VANKSQFLDIKMDITIEPRPRSVSDRVSIAVMW